MAAFDPQHLNQCFNDCLSRGDLEGMVDLYEPDALLCPTPGLRIAGHGQIREQLKGLLTLNGELRATQKSCVIQGEFALLHGTWEIDAIDGLGNPVAMAGRSSKLVRKGADGAWRIVMDLPMALADQVQISA